MSKTKSTDKGSSTCLYMPSRVVAEKARECRKFLFQSNLVTTGAVQVLYLKAQRVKNDDHSSEMVLIPACPLSALLSGD